MLNLTSINAHVIFAMTHLCDSKVKLLIINLYLFRYVPKNVKQYVVTKVLNFDSFYKHKQI